MSYSDQTIEPVDYSEEIIETENPLDLPLPNATFAQAWSRFWTKWNVFSGRDSRSEFWWVAGTVYLINSLLFFALSRTSFYDVLTTLDGQTVAVAEVTSSWHLLWTALIVAFNLLILIPHLALTWRRLHDANLAGPWFFITFVPFVGSLILVILLVLPSKPEGRRFDVPSTIEFGEATLN